MILFVFEKLDALLGHIAWPFFLGQLLGVEDVQARCKLMMKDEII